MDDFIMTIDSDTEDVPVPSKTNEDAHFDTNFTFDVTIDPYTDLVEDRGVGADTLAKGTRLEPISIDDIIARRRVAFKRKRKTTDGEDSDDYDEESEDEDGESDEDVEEFDGIQTDQAEEEDPLATSGEEDEDEHEHEGDNEEASPEEGSSSSDESEEETQLEKDRKTAFFETPSSFSDAHDSFITMNLSRPLLKSLTTMGFQKPTPIQAATIPMALLGKDIVGGAVTGSGKTAAFTIPMIERLLYRGKGKKAAATRCLVLVPTRELAVQCFEVGTKLATHTDIAFCLIVGGLSLKSQEAVLRNRPDVVIATPGRLIDHIHNSPSFTLENLDILVLDEADRILSDGFADELAEIVKSCPKSRQTMLFSATMTDSVDELVKMSLNKPVRLFVDPKRTMARGLVQEFVRVRAGKETERSALLVTLCKRTFKSNVIIFVRSKKLAHQLRIVFSLVGLKSEELHGDLTQEQRLKALQQFRDGAVDYLLATDLASRGLDIKGIETVINYDMPGQLAQYLHRVGRTARAGANGRSVTLVGEADRKMLKAAIKHGAGEDKVRHRIVPSEAVAKWVEKLEELKDEIAEILKEEKEEKQLRQADMELKKGQNMIEHEAEIFSRPARAWFQSEKEKKTTQALSKQEHEGRHTVTKQKKDIKEDKPKRDKFAGLSRKAKRRKLAMETDAEDGDGGAIKAAIRSAKKAARPAKIGDPERRRPASSRIKSRKKTRATTARISWGGGSFRKDFGDNAQNRTEGVRAKKGDNVGGMGKKGKHTKNKSKGK
ncbi:nucleolar DEAD-box protein required for synthesis of 60S ribosomal subunit [Marasmius oreades]|uniref:RNA helicase n=1 Tax=Marasmius oreades TaxID=181124 RepID=A0A9P7V2Q9_9AGAR|nr:nucleolar DEAD-box protein required for synthesis of 60S ribosomal subunit [Marasmius oreades]KAG7099249.1 nucleolar DEAD-box protein required for synthesis of 60S ribosomal subunit [Marasmius oreades]